MGADASEREIRALAEGVLRRQRGAVAAALDLIEDRRPFAATRARSLLRALAASGGAGTAHVVGLTGAPGVGKSTLAGALAGRLRQTRRTVAVLAVDPSSARSGGALLGDRLRIAADPGDAELFVRSMAARGRLGGLAAAVPAGVRALASAFDVVLVETIGVGQGEADVRHVADTLLLLLQPGAGDGAQLLKAGLLEVPDVVVVTKADLPGAEQAVAEARGRLPHPVVPVSCTAGQGIGALLDALDALHARRLRDGALAAVRRRGSLALVLAEIERRFGSEGVARAGGVHALARLAATALAGQTPEEVEESLARLVRSALRVDV